MYGSVLFVGINNCSTVQPIVAVERTVFYRERAAGMYSALPYALAQVGSPISYKELWQLCSIFLGKENNVLSNWYAGDCGNSIRVCSNYILYTSCVCHGVLWMDSCQILLVLFYLLLLLPLLHILRHDDCIPHAKPPSSSYFCSSFLFPLQSFLRLLYPKTCK